MKNLRHTRKSDDISLLVLLSCNNPSSLAVKYFFMTNDGTAPDAELVIHPFNAVEEQNDYEVSARQNTGLSSFSVVDVHRSVD